jgi:ComF family protein
VSIVASVLNLLYPPACLLCDRPCPSEQAVCLACERAMPRLEPPLCRRCGLDLRGAYDADMECAACRRAPEGFETARAPWRYAALTRTAIHRFKYRRRWRLGRWLADGMAATARTSLSAPADVVIPVPLHGAKRWLRGSHPAGDLAASVAASLGVPCSPRALIRTRWTGTQTRRSWHRRARNVTGAFRAMPGDVRGFRVLLVDDVLTSGATANACAIALKEAGAGAVYVLTAARTPLS